MHRISTFLLLLLILPTIALAQSGKLRGKITDQETGEALIGANVIIVGTSFGSASDVNGEYIILNLTAGVYEVKCSYIGYQTKTISNVRVNADLTTELNFELPAEGVQVGTVEVVALKPLVNKYNTNANRITTSDDIEALPIRGVDNILAVTSVPDQKKGEQLAVLYMQDMIKRSKLIDAINSSDLSNIAKPKQDNLIPVDQLPLLGSGKLDVLKLKTIAIERITK